MGVVPFEGEEDEKTMGLLEAIRELQRHPRQALSEAMGDGRGGDPMAAQGKALAGAGADGAEGIADLMATNPRKDQWHAPMVLPEENLGQDIGAALPTKSSGLAGSIADLLMGKGQSHAKAPMKQPVPDWWHAPMAVPEKLKEGWHPPLNTDQPNAMPNQPRDISKPKPKPKPSGRTAAQLGQDPTAIPLPSNEERSKVNAGLRLPPVEKPIAPTYKDMASMSGKQPLDDPKGLLDPNIPREEQTAESIDGMTGKPWGQGEPPDSNMPPEPEATPDPFAESGAVPKEIPISETPPPAQMGSNPDDPRQKLKDYLDRQSGGSPGMQDANRLRARSFDDSARATGNQNGMLQLAALFNQSANMVGSMGGHVASAAPIEQAVKQMQGDNTHFQDTLMKQKDSSTSNLKQMQDEKMKGMMFLAKQAEDKEKYGTDLALRRDTLNALTGYRKDSLKVQDRRNELDSGYKAAMLDATAGGQESKNKLTDAQIALLSQKTANLKEGKPEKGLTDVDRARIDLIKAQTDKTKRDANAPPKPAEMALEDKEFISKLGKDNGTAVTARNNYEGFLKAYDSAPTEAAKINFVRANLKTLQSMEGPDAINGTDEPRLMGYLNQVRPGAVFQDGGKVFGTDLKAFRDDIQRRINIIDSKLKGNQDAIRKAKSSGSLSDMKTNNGTPTVVRKQQNKAMNKTRITYSDGRVEEVDGLK